ncbi:SDR family oxidoreductase [Phytohabitans houttuyneae]
MMGPCLSCTRCRRGRTRCRARRSAGARTRGSARTCSATRASAPGTAQAPLMTALGRLGTPDDIAAVVAFLVGPDGRWVTGQNIRATGGLLL